VSESACSIRSCALRTRERVVREHARSPVCIAETNTIIIIISELVVKLLKLHRGSKRHDVSGRDFLVHA